MRHKKRRRRLSRFGSSRKALLKNMAISLLREEKISTTLARAKELRRLIDKLINLGKEQDLNNWRTAFRLLGNREAVGILFKDIALRFKEANSGYTRIIHFRNRRGDNAEMAVIELTVQKPKEKKPVAPKKKKVAKKEKMIEAPLSEEKKETLIPEEEKILVEKKKVVEPIREKEIKAEEKKAPTPKKERPKGFLDGLRSLFRRKKEEKQA